MCLAVPMRVVSIDGVEDDFLTPQTAVVESAGLSKTVRLDIIDRWPECGDYVIVHAGFAIRCLEQAEAEANLDLMREMAEATAREDDKNNGYS